MKRTTNLVTFAKLLDEETNRLRRETDKKIRITKILSPVSGGPVWIHLDNGMELIYISTDKEGEKGAFFQRV
jgi:hypothetical protein